MIGEIRPTRISWKFVPATWIDIVGSSEVCANCNQIVHQHGDVCEGKCEPDVGVLARTLKRWIWTALRIPPRCRRCHANLPSGHSGTPPRWQLCRPCWLLDRDTRQNLPWKRLEWPQNERTVSCAHCRKDIEGNNCDGCWYGNPMQLTGRSTEDGDRIFVNPMHGVYPIGHDEEICEYCWSWPNTGSCLKCTGFIHSACADKCDAPAVHRKGHEWLPIGIEHNGDYYYRRIFAASYKRYIWQCRRCHKHCLYRLSSPRNDVTTYLGSSESTPNSIYTEIRPPPSDVSKPGRHNYPSKRSMCGFSDNEQDGVSNLPVNLRVSSRF